MKQSDRCSRWLSGYIKMLSYIHFLFSSLLVMWKLRWIDEKLWRLLTVRVGTHGRLTYVSVQKCSGVCSERRKVCRHAQWQDAMNHTNGVKGVHSLSSKAFAASNSHWWKMTEEMSSCHASSRRLNLSGGSFSESGRRRWAQLIRYRGAGGGGSTCDIHFIWRVLTT